MKKTKEVSVQLLCEEETSNLVGRKLGLAEERLRTLQKKYAAIKGDVRDKANRTTTAQQGVEGGMFSEIRRAFTLTLTY